MKKKLFSGKCITYFSIVVVILFSMFFFKTSPTENSMLAPHDIVTRGDIIKETFVTGILKPSKTILIGTQVNGQLKKIYVKEGEKVKNGQLLAEIDPSLQQAELLNARAQLEGAIATKKSAEALLKQYHRELLRQKKLKRDGAGIPLDYDNAMAKYESQKEQVSANEAQITQAKMAVETAKANLGYTKIIAPADGEVIGVIASEGQTVVSSQSAPTILVIADIDRMKVEVNISEMDIQNIKTGQPLRFYVSSNPKVQYESTMGIIQQAPKAFLEEENTTQYNNVNQQPSYYTAMFFVNNNRRNLKIGMTTEVFIKNYEKKNVLRIPVEALIKKVSDDKYLVKKIKDGKVIDLLIHTGVRNEQFIEVTNGLKEGDTILLKSGYNNEV
ncbi:TPA: efflux RND transporter periplasmic adaptor subunit [Escherichia coli]|nr:efflux RND transporter periplasmic adaptor subunit [Escherichia coli]HCL9715752.1 efflux RND transporter periplasmic adaptor subunit [Escherichia coli]